MPSIDLSRARVAALGAGKMGSILIGAFLKSGLFTPEQLIASVQHASTADALAHRVKVRTTTDNIAAAREADILLVGVKPMTVAELVTQIRPALSPEKLLISFAASVKTGAIEAASGLELPVVRAMPNTPATLGAGMTAICRGRFATAEDLKIAASLFESVGRTV